MDPPPIQLMSQNNVNMHNADVALHTEEAIGYLVSCLVS